MGLGDDVTQVATDVVGQVADVAGGVVKQATKTPLDILEDLLGQAPPSDQGEGGDKSPLEQLEKNQQAGDDAAKQAAVQQKLQDDQRQTAEKLKLHRQNMAAQDQFYQQQKAEEQQRRKIEEQQKEEKKKFEIKQLEQKRKENLQVKMAKDATNAEKAANLSGAG